MNIRTYIKNILLESVFIEEEMIDEERITNPESKEKVRARENFIASHIYGEDIGDYGEMYVSYSYGEQFPAYLWHKGKWYHNTDRYVNEDGTVNEFNKQHMEDMRPTNDTHGISGRFMQSMIHKFMHKHGIQTMSHTSLEPGEK